MVVVVSSDKGSRSKSRIAGSLAATKFLMKKLNISAPEALEKLGLAKIDRMPRSFRKRLSQGTDLPANKEFSLANEQIKAADIFRANSALDKKQVAELCRFVSSHPKFEIRYKFGKPGTEDYRVGFSKEVSGCVLCDLEFKLLIHRERNKDLIIPLNEVTMLQLNKPS